MFKNITLLILFISSLSTQAQIKGRIFAFGTDNPIPNASIYFDGTYKGTIADDNGNFHLETSGSNRIPIIISAVGYFSGAITDYSADTLIRVYLKPKTYNLDAVVISSDGMPRKIKEGIFIKDFIGTTANAQTCSILNIDDVTLVYSKKASTLEAFCDKPLIIINKSLGYKITYYLDKFKSTTNSFNYAGHHFFEENIPQKSSQLKKINKRREDAYLGSRMHFIRSLWNNSLKKDGFKIFWYTKATTSKNLEKGLTADSILVITDSEKKFILKID